MNILARISALTDNDVAAAVRNRLPPSDLTELREAGYLESGRHGNTRLLKPTRKFYEEFQLAQN